VALGADVEGLDTRGDLQRGIEAAEQMLADEPDGRLHPTRVGCSLASCDGPEDRRANL
jgi:hypothetical protein